MNNYLRDFKSPPDNERVSVPFVGIYSGAKSPIYVSKGRAEGDETVRIKFSNGSLEAAKDIITDRDLQYLASEKLPETTSTKNSGCLAVNSFGDAKMVSHSFSNGYGIISFDRDLTIIGDYAFNGCRGLTSVSIPQGVTFIGGYAFSGCTGITSISIPQGVTFIGGYAFSGCTGITSISIPQGVTIKSRAFSGCSGLTIEIPDGFQGVISMDAFEGTKKIIFPQVLDGAPWGASDFEYTGPWGIVNLGYSNTSILDRYSRTNIVYLAFGQPDSDEVKIHIESSFDESSFSENGIKSGRNTHLISANKNFNGDFGCYYLHYNSSKKYISIQWNNFPGDFSIANVRFGEISENQLWYTGNSKLPETTSTKSSGCLKVDAFGEAKVVSHSFQDRQGLITFDRPVISIGDYAFYGSSISSISFPSGITSIGNNAFRECSIFVSTIVLPESLKEIGSYAFYKWDYLELVKIPEGVTTIKNFAFANCTRLTVDIPVGVTSIGSDAFKDVKKLILHEKPAEGCPWGAKSYEYLGSYELIRTNLTITNGSNGGGPITNGLPPEGTKIHIVGTADFSFMGGSVESFDEVTSVFYSYGVTGYKSTYVIRKDSNCLVLGGTGFPGTVNITLIEIVS